MCWSGEASAALAAAGFAGTAWAAWKKEPMPIWASLGYFSLMEALQAFTYSVIDGCSLPSNQIATLLGYLHITFQPFFINIVSLHFVRRAKPDWLVFLVYATCFASAVIMLMQLYPFGWAGHCLPGRPMCSENLCSVHGNWHIAWNVPTNGIGNGLHDLPGTWGSIVSWWFGNGYPTYVIAGFILPLLYGSWRFTLYHFLMGPQLAWLLTDNPNEWPAVWCLLSIGLLLIVVKTPVRKILYVGKPPPVEP
jgi:hypothetical protein